MRRSRSAALFLTCFTLLAACDEDPQIWPLRVGWLEWPDTVVAATAFPLRVIGPTSSDPKNVRLVVRADTATVSVEAYSVAPPCTPGCPPGFFFFDTIVQVPAIPAAAPRTVALRARTQDILVQERLFGTLTAAPGAAARPANRAAGQASGFQDSFGCFIVVAAPFTLLYVDADQSPAWAPGFTGFVHARFDPALASTCMVITAPVVIVDSIR